MADQEADTLGALAKRGDIGGLQRKMRWESKSPNDPVSEHVSTASITVKGVAFCISARLKANNLSIVWLCRRRNTVAATRHYIGPRLQATQTKICE